MQELRGEPQMAFACIRTNKSILKELPIRMNSKQGSQDTWESKRKPSLRTDISINSIYITILLLLPSYSILRHFNRTC